MSAASGPTIDNVMTVVRLQLGLREVAPDSHLTEDLGAASVDIVNIVATLEDNFAIEIDDADLDRLATVRDLCDIARAKWRTLR